MKETYRERPQQPICTWDEIQWEQPMQMEDETGAIRFCWPLASEAQMWEQARCRECNQPARWVGIGNPFGNGEQYFMESDAWCYWCLPREHFTDEELRLLRKAWGGSGLEILSVTGSNISWSPMLGAIGVSHANILRTRNCGLYATLSGLGSRR